MKTRILSAIILLAIFIPVLITGGDIFAILMGIMAIGGLYELIKIRESKNEFPFMMKIFAYLLVLFFTLFNFESTYFTYNVDYRVMTFIIFAFLIPIIFINDNKKYNINDALFLISSTLFIGMSFNLAIIIRNYDLMYLVYILLITAVTDTFALVTGKLVGKHALAKKVSPNKTIEGLMGGLIFGVVVATTFYHQVINPELSLVMISAITLLLAVIGQIGDLVFSSIKRYYDKKDFSNLIPGHGGILDRLDSIVFVILAFILFLNII